MKRILLCCLLMQALLTAMAQRHISIFSDHIAEIARQKHITFREAAQKVYNMGYRGVDVWYTINPEEQAILDEIGFKHASAISHIDFTTGEHQDEVARSIDFMLSHGYNKVLLVPGLLPENPSTELLQQVYILMVPPTEGAESLEAPIPRWVCMTEVTSARPCQLDQ